jgi:hypothetical protein
MLRPIATWLPSEFDTLRLRISTLPSKPRPRCERLLDRLGGAADVEGPHGQLRARLADRLRGDDADGLADIDRRAAGQIAAVAGAADAGLRVRRSAPSGS